MIFTERTITVRKGTSTINESIILYRGDFQVGLKFTILDSKYKFLNGANLIESEKATYAQLAVLKPKGDNIFSEVVKCSEGSVTFTMTKEMIDELEEVGKYSFQIRLFDANKESRVSIPPVEFGMEVREPVASEDHTNKTNEALTGYSIAKVTTIEEDKKVDTFDSNGNYNKTNWKTGDRITENKLNKVEDALYKLNQNDKTLDNKINSNFNIIASTKLDRNSILSMSNMGQDVKEAMTGGSVAVVGRDSILSENIVDGQVTYSKTNFFSEVIENMIDMGKVSETGWAIINGNPTQADNYKNLYRVTDYVKINPSKKYVLSPDLGNRHNVGVYDSNLRHIRTINGGWTNPISFNEGDAYARFTIGASGDVKLLPADVSDSTSGVVVKFNEPITTHINEIIENRIDKGLLFSDIIGIDHYGGNLLNPSDYEDGTVLGSNGELTSGDDWTSTYFTTGFVEVKPGYSYTMSLDGQKIANYIATYDVNKRFIKLYMGSSDWNGDIVIPDDCRYVRLNYLIKDKEYAEFMLTEDLALGLKDFVYDITDYAIKDAIAHIKKKDKTVDYKALDLFDFEQSINLYDPSKATPEGTAVNAYTGAIYNVSGYRASDFIPVEENTQYCVSRNHNIAVYDKDKKFIEGKHGGSWKNPLTMPAGAAYLRVTIDIPSHPTGMVTKGSILPTYTPYQAKAYFRDENAKKEFSQALGINTNVDNSASNKLKGLKWNVLGDSITSTDYARPNWWEIISSKYDMTVNGYGISGTTLAHTNDRHLWDYNWGKLNATEIGYVASDSSTWHTGNCMVERYVKMADDADIITVMGGTNDGGVPIGNPNDTRTDTFYGACNTLFKGLVEKYPDKIVAVFTPIQPSNAYTSNRVGDIGAYVDSLSATSTVSLQGKAEIIKRVAARYSIPVLDLYNESGINGIGGRRDLLFRPNDTLHPSAEGNKWMARVIENFLLKLL